VEPVIDVPAVLRAPTAPFAPDDQAPTLSVLVPAYNAASTIGDALESLLSQRPAIEQVVVSDDGSEDDLDRALAPFRDWITVVRGPNAGLAVARNRAAAVASGALLGLLDADDVWLPGRAAALREAARLRPDLDVITTDALVVSDGRAEAQTYYGKRGWPAGDQVDAIVRASFIFGAAGIRREAFDAVGGYDERARFAEDWDLWLRMLARGSRAGLVDVPLYEYRRRPNSLTRRRVDLAVGVVAVLERAHALPFTAAQRSALRRTEGEWRVRSARRAIDQRDPRRLRLALSTAAAHGVRARSRLSVLARLGRGSRRRRQ
jgi:glycosyltransferase involved in cell wall biosynthesis